jgi:mRNA interferase RelE/StbE
MADQKYALRYKKSVKKDLKQLPEAARKIVIEKILRLASDPRPAGSTKLRGSLDLYRLRHADYRVVYHIDDGQLIILVVKVGHRREIYRDY